MFAFPLSNLVAGSNGANRAANYAFNGSDLTITSFTSNCSYDNATGESTFALDLTVMTTNAPAGENLVVAFNDIQLISQAPDASGTTTFTGLALSEGPGFGNVLTVSFATTMECSAVALVDLIACTPSCAEQTSTDFVGGNVFDDPDNDGADAGAGGVANTLVRVFDCAGELVCEVYTNADGDWSCDGVPMGDSVRVEYSNPLQPQLDETFSGTDNGTSVQFLVGGDCDADYGVLNTSTFCPVDATTRAIIPCYAPGTADGLSANVEAAILFELGNSGIPAPNGGTAPSPEPLALTSEIGSTWGTAYSPAQNHIFLTTVLKRYVGLAGSTGAVYLADPDVGFIGSFDLQGVNGLDFGSVTRNQIDGDDNELAVDGDDLYLDYDAFTKIGKVGFGDTEIDPSGDFLWSVNLNSRTLVRVDISQPGLLPTDGSAAPAGLVEEFTVDYPTCANGVARPWGLQFFEGTGYLGVVCDASANTAPDDQTGLVGYVLAFDPQNPTVFTNVLTVPFDYPREDINDKGPVDGEWHGWQDDFDAIAQAPATTRVQGANYQIGYPQPIISDLAFSEDGTLTLGIMDRFGHQVASNQVAALGAGTVGNGDGTYDRNTLFRGISGGDVLKACFINGSYVLEGSAGCTDDQDVGGNSTSATDGPGGAGEFYHQDRFHNPQGTGSFHAEISLGSVAAIPGTDDVLNVVYDPISDNPPNGDARFSSQGVHYYSTVDGEFSTANDYGNTVGAYELVPPNSDLGKAAGLGGVTLICPAPLLEVGNYAWVDENADGVQQACEPPLAGLTVKLYSKDGGALLATTMTDATGNYYFAGDGLDDATWEDVEEDTLVANNEYFIAFCGDNDYDAELDTFSVAGQLYCISPTDTGEGPTQDVNDSDVSELDVAGATLPAYCTEDGELLGGTNHTFDAGFKPLCPFVDLVDDGPTLCGTDTVAVDELIDSVALTEIFMYELMTDGDGTFLTTDGSATTVYAPGVRYVPGAADRRRGAITISVMAADPGTACPPALDVVVVTILNVDCGSFFWDGTDNED